jgi:hypothetical protein
LKGATTVLRQDEDTGASVLPGELRWAKTRSFGRGKERRSLRMTKLGELFALRDG